MISQGRLLSKPFSAQNRLTVLSGAGSIRKAMSAVTRAGTF